MDIEKIKSIVDKKHLWFVDKDDLINETVLYCLENNIDDLEQAVNVCFNKLNKDDYNYHRRIAKSIYNDDGECLDDNYYFVDPKTVEQYGEGRRISEDLANKGVELATTINNLNCLIRRVCKPTKEYRRTLAYEHFSRLYNLDLKWSRYKVDIEKRSMNYGKTRLCLKNKQPFA